MSLERLVSFYKTRDLTGEDIETLTGRAPIVYSDLKQFNSIQQLLGKWKFVILLYQTSSASNGHFVCLRESDKGELSFSDSYGYHWDTEQHFGARYDLNIPRYLSMLIEKDGRDCTWNRFDYQRKAGAVASCGRWSSVFACWRNLSFDDIHNLFTQNSDAWLQDYDNAVVTLTLLPLHNIREFFEKRMSLPIPMKRA
jgi:hypothetical protein